LTPADASALARRLEENVTRVIRGKHAQVRHALVALFARGHLLLEDVPGVGKTMLAKAIARSIRASFKRVQFTPDLLPSDITGVSIFNQKDASFEFRRGPVFANVLLADEINRATPRTQSALLEAMEERQVTADGTTHALGGFFFVVATQNPIELAGTFPLPEAELDRFLLMISLGYPGAEVEAELLERHRAEHPIERLEPALALDEVEAVQAAVPRVHVDAALRRYVVDVVERTRRHKDVVLGASPRASFGLMRAAQALALFEGEAFVRPEHVKSLAHAALDHRVIVRPQARVAGVAAHHVVAEALRGVEVPIGLA
jgi:MoxR-like ATPase